MRPASTRCHDELAALLVSRRWGLGERLPSESDLARQLGVARNTLRSVLERLVQDGCLTRVPGRGRKSRGMAVSAFTSSAGGRGVLAIGRFPVVWPVDQPDSYSGQSYLAGDALCLGALQSAGHLLRAAHAGDIDPSDGGRALLARASAVVVLPSAADHASIHDLARHAHRLGLPVILSCVDPVDLPADRVFHDHTAGISALIKHLAEHGHRRIVSLGAAEPWRWWMRLRHSGYGHSLVTAGLTPLHRQQAWLQDVSELPEPQRSEVRTQQLMGFVHAAIHEQRADALLADDDHGAVAIIRAAQRLGLRMPRDLAVVGYDALWPTLTARAGAPIATIDQDWPEQGRQLARVAIDRITGRLPPVPQTILMPPRLLVTGKRTRT